MLKLVEASVEYLEQLEDYREELIRCAAPDGCRSLYRSADAAEWLEWTKMRRYSESETEHLLALREQDGKVVGIVQLHHALTEYMENYIGQIGYAVRPSERRKGYATMMLSAVLQHCKELGWSKILICCAEDNEASRRTIEKNGGIFDAVVSVPDSEERRKRYYIPL